MHLFRHDAAIEEAGVVEPDAGSPLPPGCPEVAPSPLTRATFTVRTTSAGGRYSPRNVGAVWVERADGTFVKTLSRWAARRAGYLTRFQSSSGGNVVDAVTSATLSSHQTHSVEWGLDDVDACPAGQGAYRLVVEMTDRNGTGPTAEFPFELGAAPGSTSFADASNFHDLQLTLE